MRFKSQNNVNKIRAHICLVIFGKVLFVSCTSSLLISFHIYSTLSTKPQTLISMWPFHKHTSKWCQSFSRLHQVPYINAPKYVIPFVDVKRHSVYARHSNTQCGLCANAFECMSNAAETNPRCGGRQTQHDANYTMGMYARVYNIFNYVRVTIWPCTASQSTYPVISIIRQLPVAFTRVFLRQANLVLCTLSGFLFNVQFLNSQLKLNNII